jgi:hypothetical protein
MPRSRRGAGRVATALVVCAAALASIASPTLADGWTRPRTVAAHAQLSALHEVAAVGDIVVVAHARIGPGAREDRLMLHRSTDGGATWPVTRTLFTSGKVHRVLVPNLAVATSDALVIVTWRARGPTGTWLFLRTSRDGGLTFGRQIQLVGTSRPRGLGVPAVAISDRAVVVAWTDRKTGDVRIRRSQDGARSFGAPRTLARTRLTIDCFDPAVRDGLVGLVAAAHRIHLAWSDAPAGECLASRIRSRTSGDDGLTWGRPKLVTGATTFGWAELAARGRRMLASVQAPDGSLVVARSTDGGRTFAGRRIRPSAGRELGAGDVTLRQDGRAWIAYPDLAYSGEDVESSRLQIRYSTDSGATWGPAATLLGDAPRLRQAPNVVLRRGLPVVVFQGGPADGSSSDIRAMRRT